MCLSRLREQFQAHLLSNASKTAHAERREIISSEYVHDLAFSFHQPLLVTHSAHDHTHESLDDPLETDQIAKKNEAG